MIRRIQVITRIIIALFIIISLTPFVHYQALAKKSKKKPKKENVRNSAIDLIRKSSESICELAGLEPINGDYTNGNDEEGLIGELGEDIEELEKEDDVTVDLETFKNLWLSYVNPGESMLTSTGVNKADIINEIMEWLGTPYKFGGVSENGIDCSAFIRHLILKTHEIMIPRTAREQYTLGKEVKRDKLEFGDLVFFQTRKRVYISHVGIYLGDNLFAHASSRYGVTISSLESSYYNKRFIGAKRIAPEDLKKYSIKIDKINNSSM